MTSNYIDNSPQLILKTFSKWFIYSVLSGYIFYILLASYQQFVVKKPLALPLSVLIIGGTITLYVSYILSKAIFNYKSILNIILFSFITLVAIICLYICPVDKTVCILFIPTILFMRTVSTFRNTILLTLCSVIFICYIEEISFLIGINANKSHYEGRENLFKILQLIIILFTSYFSLLILYFYGKIESFIPQECPELETANKSFINPAEENSGERVKYIQLYRQIIEVFEKEKLYQDPDFSIKKLSEHLDSNGTYISKALNQIGNTKFTNLVNHYRVSDVLGSLNNRDYKHFTIEHIYSQSGFSQQPTFNRIFKEHTGLTPREYIDNLK